MSINAELQALNREYKTAAGLNWRTAYLGNGNGVIYDPTQDGNVFVRFPASDDNLTAPVSVRLRASIPIIAEDTQIPVKVGVDKDNKLAVLDIDFDALPEHGISPLDANAADQRRAKFVAPDRYLPAFCFSTSAPGDLTTEVAIEPLFYIVDGEVHLYEGEILDLAASIPAANLHRTACLFLKNDDTIERVDSTAKNTIIPLGKADVQECVDGATTSAKPLWAWRLRNNQASISDDDRWLDLRQRINASNNVTKEKTIVVQTEMARLGATPPTATIISNYMVLQFAGAGAVTHIIYTSIHVPQDWIPGTDIKIHFHWAPTDGNAGNVKWQITWSALASNVNEVLTDAGTSTFVIDATEALQDELLKTDDMTIAGASLAIEDIIGVKIFRDPTDGADTYGSTASLVNVEFVYAANL